MKTLIICCDGTWNTPDQEQFEAPAPTNVVRLYNALAARGDAGQEQRRYYHPGVGTEGGVLARTAGGMYGYGLGRNVMSAYQWLAANFEPGDAIYLFGFSRGAFTVRSLSGMVGRCGLLDLRILSPADAWKRVETAYQRGYRDKDKNKKWNTDNWPLLQPTDNHPGKVPIQLIGVWDTVGALGIPDDMALLNLLDSSDRWTFHDARLGENVRYARHALAIDEMRASFTPTLWTDANDKPVNDADDTGRVRQLWFPGVHSDVGGGYHECGLADIALDWMISQARLAGLVFDEAFTDQIRPNAQGQLHDSLRGAFKVLRTRPRNVPAFDSNTWFHRTAKDRHQNPPITQSPYHLPTVKLAVGQSSDPITVYARKHWNETGLYLEGGATYQFTARGEWLDRNIACGPAGSKDGNFQPGEVAHAIGSLIGKAEGLFQKLAGNKNADFMMSRRVEHLPWFSLVGVIANDGLKDETNPQADGSPQPHSLVPIGGGTELNVEPGKSGYLYAFANDAWHFYDNNRGSVTLTVKRTA